MVYAVFSFSLSFSAFFLNLAPVSFAELCWVFVMPDRGGCFSSDNAASRRRPLRAPHCLFDVAVVFDSDSTPVEVSRWFISP